MKNIFSTIIICLVIGIIMSFLVFNQYDVKASIEDNTIYLIQIAVYSNMDNLNNNININQYIYREEKDGIHVYVAVTKNKEKLKTIFENMGYEVCIKQEIATHKEFIEIVKNADLLLEEINDEKAILEIIRQVLERYEEYEYN